MHACKQCRMHFADCLYLFGFNADFEHWYPNGIFRFVWIVRILKWFFFSFLFVLIARAEQISSINPNKNDLISCKFSMLFEWNNNSLEIEIPWKLHKGLLMCAKKPNSDYVHVCLFCFSFFFLLLSISSYWVYSDATQWSCIINRNYLILIANMQKIRLKHKCTYTFTRSATIQIEKFNENQTNVHLELASVRLSSQRKSDLWRIIKSYKSLIFDILIENFPQLRSIS